MSRTLIASDNFNRADGPVGSNWAYLFDTSWQGLTPAVYSNMLVGKASGAHYQAIRWIGAGTIGNDQYSKATLQSFTWQDATYLAGVGVRMSADIDAAADYYAVWIQDDGSSNRTSKLIKKVNGTDTVLDTRSTAWTNGDTVALEAIGTTLIVYKNDVELFRVTDSSLTTGQPGIVIGSNSNVPALDNWEGGNASASGAASLTVVNSVQSATSSAVNVSSGASTGTITTLPLKNNTGTLLASQTGITAYVYKTTGEYVATFTGLSSGTDGVVTMTSASIVPGTTYRFVIIVGTSEGMDKAVAA